MCLVGMSKVPDTPEQLPSGVCLAPRACVSWGCYFLGQRQGRCPPGRQWGQADVGGNTSPLQSLPPPIPVRLHSPTSLSLSHTHTHTHTELPKGKKPALRVQAPDPEDSSLQGCSQQLEGLRFLRGNPPALLPPASCRASGPNPGPQFPGSRPHPFLPAGGGGGWRGVAGGGGGVVGGGGGWVGTQTACLSQAAGVDGLPPPCPPPCGSWWDPLLHRLYESTGSRGV